MRTVTVDPISTADDDIAGEQEPYGLDAPDDHNSSEGGENLGEQPALPTAVTLKWSDFKKLEEQKEPGINAETARTLKAEVDFTTKVTNRVVGNDIEYTITVDKIDAKKFTSSFDAEGSYYVGNANEGDEGATLLKHEQLHLRIGAYIAEKAVANFPDAAFKQLKVTYKVPRADAGDQAKVEAAAEQPLKDLDKLADDFIATYRAEKWLKIDEAVQEDGAASYDAQTMHGTLPVKQKDWEDNWKAKTDAILKEKGWDK